MKFILYLTLLIVCCFMFYSGCSKEAKSESKAVMTNAIFMDTNTVKAVEIKLLYIIPLSNFSSSSYPNSSLVKDIVFNSFYSFMAYLPKITAPGKNRLIELSSGDKTEIMKKENPDFIIDGDYTLTGGKKNPKAVIRLQIWSKMSGEAFSKTYKTPTDMDIFDTIDRMIEDAGGFMLKEKMKLASVSFSGFKIGPFDYDLIINDRHIARVTNNAFSLNIKILAGEYYSVRLVRLLDNKALINRDILLQAGDSTNISYKEKKYLAADFERQIKKDGQEYKYGEVTAQNYVQDNGYLYLNGYYTERSTLEISLSENDVKEGKHSLLIKADNKKWTGLDIMPGGLFINWNNISILRMWVHNNLENDVTYIFGFTDINNEMFLARITIGGRQWKWINMPISSFKSRNDFQVPGAKVNRVADFPLKNIKLFELNTEPYNTSSGKQEFCIDQVELVE